MWSNDKDRGLGICISRQNQPREWLLTLLYQLSALLRRRIFTQPQRIWHGAFSVLRYSVIKPGTFCVHLKKKKTTSSHWVKSNQSLSYWPTLTWVWTPWHGRGSSLHLSSQDKRQAENSSTELQTKLYQLERHLSLMTHQLPVLVCLKLLIK